MTVFILSLKHRAKLDNQSIYNGYCYVNKQLLGADTRREINPLRTLALRFAISRPSIPLASTTKKYKTGPMAGLTWWVARELNPEPWR